VSQQGAQLCVLVVSLCMAVEGRVQKVLFGRCMEGGCARLYKNAAAAWNNGLLMGRKEG
jgi:hypothetical protein